MFLMFCFSIYLQMYWQCKCKPSCDSYRRPSGEAFVSSVGQELLNLFLHVVETVRSDDDDAGNGNIVVLQQQKKY